MPNIALFDDRKTDRDSLMLNFQMTLPSGWACIPSPPLPEPSQYREWIVREDVTAIVFDWILNEQKDDVESPVRYKGQALVRAVREHFPTMPLFVITAQPGDGDLQDHFGDVEAVFTRKDFSSEPKKYIKTLIRAAERFSLQFQEELSELSVLSAKIATGNATKADLEKAKAIQTALGLASDNGDDAGRAEALRRVEEAVGKLERLGSDIKRELERKRK